MTQVTADFEAGVDGNNITTGDPGSLTAWDNVTTAGSATVKYSSVKVAHGLLSAQFNNVTSSSAWLEWNTSMGTTVDNYGRIYVYRDSLDTGTRHYWLSMFSSAAAFIGRLYIDETTGTIGIQNSAGAVAATGAVAVATGRWTRFEYKIINNTSTGILEVKLFNTADSTSADETVTATGLNTRADTAQLRFGNEQPPSAGYLYYVDDIVAGAASYPGPAAVTPTVPTQVMVARHAIGAGRW